MKWLLFLFLVITPFVQAQKKSKQTERFEYLIDSENGSKYTFGILYDISISPVGTSDSIRISGSADTSSMPGLVVVNFRGTQKFISTSDGNFYYTLSTADYNNYEVEILFDFDQFNDNSTTIAHEANTADFSLFMERKTILNDPDSGGIRISSAKKLTQNEIDEIVRCYIRKKEGVKCYDESTIQISIIL